MRIGAVVLLRSGPVRPGLGRGPLVRKNYTVKAYDAAGNEALVSNTYTTKK